MDKEFNNSAYMTYLGIAATLGRIAGRVRLNGDDEECLARAFADINRIMAARGSGQCFKKTHDGGYAMFERQRMKHPTQPIYLDEDGVPRFRENAIVKYLKELCAQRGIANMNDLALMPFSNEDREQFAQLIGYSVSGFGELPYASAMAVMAADVEAERLIK